MTSVDFGKKLHAKSLDAIAADATRNRITFLRAIIGNKRFRERSHCHISAIHMPPDGLPIFYGDDGTEKSVRSPRQRAQLQSNISTGLVEHCPIFKDQRLVTTQHNITGP